MSETGYAAVLHRAGVDQHWQCTPDDRPADGHIVVITATADDKTAEVAFEPTHSERQHE